jgi:hypothetical protein
VCCEWGGKPWKSSRVCGSTQILMYSFVVCLEFGKISKKKFEQQLCILILGKIELVQEVLNPQL